MFSLSGSEVRMAPSTSSNIQKPISNSKKARRQRRDPRSLNQKRKHISSSKKIHKVVEFQFKRHDREINIATDFSKPRSRFEFKSQIETTIPYEDPSIWESRGLLSWNNYSDLFLTKKYNLVTLEDAEKVFEPRPPPNEDEINSEGHQEQPDELKQTNSELVVKDPEMGGDVPESSEENVAPKEESESLKTTSSSDQDSGLASHSIATSPTADDSDEEEEGEFKSKGYDDLSDMDLFTSEDDDEVFLDEKKNVNPPSLKLEQEQLKKKFAVKNVIEFNDCEIISSDEEWQ